MVFAFDEFELDDDRLQLRRAGKLVKVDSSALRLMLALVRQAGQLVSKDDLVEEVWEGRAVADNVITVAMARLRKALVPSRGSKPFVATAYGRGYRFVEPVITRHSGVVSMAESEDASLPTAPFVGRDRVLARLREALSDARSGHGRLCVLMGEAGIGKTRVVEMLERELLDSGVQMAWGYCREAGETPPLWPWQQLLNEITGDEADATRPAAGALQLRDVAPSLLSESADASGPEGAASVRHRTFEAILRAFTRATRQTPWVLVLDDLQRADAASLELLSHLVDRVARTHILVVATLRSSEAQPVARCATLLPRILGHRNCERMVLERLSAEHVASYVAAFMDDPEQRFARAVHAKSEGNAFFMAELMRQLRDAADPRPETLAVPDAALDLVRERVARIDLNARGLLSTCAVLGRRFELSALSEISGREPSALMFDLDAALRAEVLVCVPNARTAFAFSHELIRAALYERLSAEERRFEHERAGQALERRLDAGDTIAASDIAYHYHAALPIGDLRRTVRFCRAAAKAAVSVFAYTEVARHTRNALEALQLMEQPSLRLRMTLLYMCAIYTRPQDPTGYLRWMEELVRLARKYRDAEMLTRAGALLNAHPGLMPRPGAQAVLEQARDLLTAESSSALRAVGLAALATTGAHCYEAEHCHSLIGEAAELTRDGRSPGASYVSLLAQLHILGGPAHEEQAAEIAAQLEQLAQNHRVELATVPVELALHRAAAALCSGSLSAARDAMKCAAARARELPHAELIWHSERISALMQAEAGEGSRAKDVLSALHERVSRQGLIGTEVFTAYDRAVVLSEPGREATDAAALRGALKYDAEDPPAIWALKVRALVAAGLRDEARASLHTVAPAKLFVLPCDARYLGTLGHLTRATLLLAEPSYYRPLQTLLERYPGHTAAHLLGACDGAVTQSLGMLSLVTGQHRQAIEQLERAIEHNERAGLHARAAETQLLLARGLLELGGTRGTLRARALARSVRASSGRLGMAQLAKDAAAVLMRADDCSV